jgi:WD40 repeat protein
VNQVTKSASHLDVIIGFNTGDIMWYEPISQKYARLNKNGSISNAAVSDIRWLPGSENLFLAACMDGTLVVYDKEKEDAAFVPEESVGDEWSEKSGSGSRTPKLKVLKSVSSRNQKTNPVAVYKLTNQKLNAFALSPSGSHLATVSEDGTLRILALHEERLLSVHRSYYGALLCVCWSPDGRYILTGGQDDLVSIWSRDEGTLVARCQGHNSWVTSVAFDPWRCDERNYRFGSVGEDARLLLWDFSVGMLHRPRAASVRQIYGSHARGGSVVSNGLNIKSLESLQHVDSSAELAGDEESIVHPVDPRARTAVLPPVMAKAVDAHALSWLRFEEDAIVTACREGELLLFLGLFLATSCIYLSFAFVCSAWPLAGCESFPLDSFSRGMQRILAPCWTISCPGPTGKRQLALLCLCWTLDLPNRTNSGSRPDRGL